jgi:DNA-directed RNA polymerase specialized sigma24 family protein
LKRGGHWLRQDVGVVEPAADAPVVDVLALDEALAQLEREHPEKAALVKLRYFTGLTQADAAAALGFSTSTADRYWRYARAWLARRLRHGTASGCD